MVKKKSVIKENVSRTLSVQGYQMRQVGLNGPVQAYVKAGAFHVAKDLSRKQEHATRKVLSLLTPYVQVNKIFYKVIRSTVENLLGSTTEVTLCDSPSCSGYTTSKDYAKSMCQKFIKADSRLSSKIQAHGYQPTHVTDRVDIACTVHCKKPSGGWYAPILELSDRQDVDVYFPDGTFCHSEGGTDYYCRKHQCLSSARGSRADKIPDLPISQNARPDGELGVSKDMEAYFSLNDDGKPESNNFQSDDHNEVPDDDWEVLDYVQN